MARTEFEIYRHAEEKRQLLESDSEMIQMLNLVQKDFKAPIIIILKKIKECMYIMNEQIGNPSQEKGIKVWKFRTEKYNT